LYIILLIYYNPKKSHHFHLAPQNSSWEEDDFLHALY